MTQTPPTPPADTPVIAVVIATKDRHQQLSELLHALTLQTLRHHHFEVLIADDASTPPLIQTITPHLYPFPLKLIRRQHPGGPGIARNTALPLLSPSVQLVAITDDDCLPDPHWLATLLAAHHQHPRTLLGGHLRNAATCHICAEASQVISDLVYSHYNSNPTDCRFFSTNNVAADAAILRELSNFNENFHGASEDRDLCDRWRAAGYKLRYVPEATLAHNHRLSLRKFLKQHFNYGKGAAVFHQQRTLRRTGRLIDEMTFHRQLPRLAWNRLRREPPAKALQLSFLLILWQIANAAGYFYGRMRLPASSTPIARR